VSIDVERIHDERNAGQLAKASETWGCFCLSVDHTSLEIEITLREKAVFVLVWVSCLKKCRMISQSAAKSVFIVSSHPGKRAAVCAVASNWRVCKWCVDSRVGRIW